MAEPRASTRPRKPEKVLVIGSGPIVIWQAAEFDYAGTQACKAMREEGVTSVLVNSNPATIMTDEGVADIVYIEPLTVDVLTRIIKREKQTEQTASGIVRAQNAAMLQIFMLVYQLLHVGRSSRRHGVAPLLIG